jgi:high-affinity iron transporter
MTLTRLVELSGGRLPIGFNASQNPGPFTASWKATGVTSVWIYNGGLLDAQRTATIIVTLSGGGLTSPRTLAPDSKQTDAWQMTAPARSAAVNAVERAGLETSELLLWKLWIPLALAIAALVLVGYVLRSAVRASRTTNPPRPVRPKRKSEENYA